MITSHYFLILWKSNTPFSRHSFFISQNFKSFRKLRKTWCNVEYQHVSQSTFWIFHFNRKSFGHEAWPINQESHEQKTAPKVSVFRVFLGRISRIWTEYGEILRISPSSVRMGENTDQKNSEYGHILRSERMK